MVKCLAPILKIQPRELFLQSLKLRHPPIRLHVAQAAAFLAGLQQKAESCENFYPSVRGVRANPGPQAAGQLRLSGLAGF